MLSSCKCVWCTYYVIFLCTVQNICYYLSRANVRTIRAASCRVPAFKHQNLLQKQFEVTRVRPETMCFLQPSTCQPSWIRANVYCKNWSLTLYILRSFTEILYDLVLLSQRSLSSFVGSDFLTSCSDKTWAGTLAHKALACLCFCLSGAAL